MSETTETMTLKELVQLLECPVCLQVKDFDTYIQCQNGHFTCGNCSSKLSACPVCRKVLKLKAITIAKETWLAFQAELRHVEDFKRNVNLKYLLEIFKCNICQLKPTKRPVRQCVNGHILCDTCSSSHTIHPKCIICDSFFFQPKYRSLIAEIILSFLAKPCRFTCHGCEIMITELCNHEKEDCIFVEVKCVFISCYTKIPIFKLKDHLAEEHENHHTLTAPLESNLGEEENKNTGHLNLPKNIYMTPWNRVLYLKLDKTYDFISVSWACKLDQRLYVWVHYLGLPCESEKFYFKLRLFSIGSCKEIVATCNVVSLNSAYFHMFIDESAFKIPYTEILDYWGSHWINLSWEVSVFQKIT